jgi:uncharacterized DUF497 family protein
VLDDAMGEQGLVMIGADALAHPCGFCTYREENIRIISAQLAERHEHEDYIGKLCRRIL